MDTHIYWEQISPLLFPVPLSFLLFLFFSRLSLLWWWSDLNCFLVKQWLHPFLPFFLTLDLWQRVRAAAATACRPPSWCRCPPHLRLHLWLWLQLAPAPHSQTANQESCLPTWRRWRYQDTHLEQQTGFLFRLEATCLNSLEIKLMGHPVVECKCPFCSSPSSIPTPRPLFHVQTQMLAKMHKNAKNAQKNFRHRGKKETQLSKQKFIKTLKASIFHLWFIRF